MDAAAVGRHDRRVAGSVLVLDGRLPEHLARLLVESDDAGFQTARRADQLVAVDERRFAEMPRGHRFAGEVLDEVLRPDDRPLLGIETHELPRVGDAVDEGAVDGRRRARAVVAAGVADLRRPENLAGVAVETDEEGRVPLVLLVAHLTHRVDAFADDREARPAVADVLALLVLVRVLGVPEELRSPVGPGGHEAAFRRDAVPVRAAPLRPIGRRHGNDDEREKEEGPSRMHESLRKIPEAGSD